MSASLDIVKGSDGNFHLVAEVEGASVVFASVNASQVHAAQKEQGIAEEQRGDTETGLGAYAGPPSDLTPSPHLAGESIGSSKSKSKSTSKGSSKGDEDTPPDDQTPPAES